MSDSLIAFQPAIDEPSNMMPSSNVPSSIVSTACARCCHLPRGSVNLRSTYLTSLSLIIFKTVFGSDIALRPVVGVGVFWSCFWQCKRNRPGRRSPYGGINPRPSRASDRFAAAFAGADADHFLDVGHEDLAVADAARVGRALDRLDRALDKIVLDHDLDLHLRQEIDHVLRAAVKLGVPLLPAEALGLGHRDALEAHLVQRVLHFIELERLDDGFDLFHRALTLLRRIRRGVSTRTVTASAKA